MPIRHWQDADILEHQVELMLGSSWAEQDLWAIFQLLVSQEDQSLFSLLPRPTRAIRRFLGLSQEDTAKMQEQHKVEPSETGCCDRQSVSPLPFISWKRLPKTVVGKILWGIACKSIKSLARTSLKYHRSQLSSFYVPQKLEDSSPWYCLPFSDSDHYSGNTHQAVLMPRSFWCIDVKWLCHLLRNHYSFITKYP